MSLTVGEVVEGKVSRITNFGAFVDLPDGRTGLVHISEVADSFVENIRDHVDEGSMVRVKVLSIDEDGKKVGLSIRQAQPGFDPRKSARRGRGAGRRRSGPSSFEDMLQKFIRDSDRKQADLRKSVASKRGGRSGRRF